MHIKHPSFHRHAAKMSDNTANINASRAVSKSPSGGKPNGGVALPLNPKL